MAFIYIKERFQLSPLLEGRRNITGARLRLEISTLATTRGATANVHPCAQVQPISTLAPTRGATPIGIVLIQRGSISTLATTRGATTLPCLRPVPSEISTHATTRGATAQNQAGVDLFGFQLTPLLEGRHTLDANILTERTVFQLTPLLEGRQRAAAKECAQKEISTHAPTRGATGRGNHIPVQLDFNSRPYTRGDLLPGHYARLAR